MLLNEIFNSKFETKWKNTSSGYDGVFYIGTDKFNIILDEYDIILDGKSFSVIDFGFKKNSSWEIQSSNIEFKSFGGVFNAMIEKINELKPDFILFGAQNKNGNVKERIALYDKMSRLLARGSSYQYESDLIKTANGIYKFIGKITPSAAGLKQINDLALSVSVKD